MAVPSWCLVRRGPWRDALLGLTTALPIHRPQALPGDGCLNSYIPVCQIVGGVSTPPWGEPVEGYVPAPPSIPPAFSHLPISRRTTPSRILCLSSSRNGALSRGSKNFRMSTSKIHPLPF